MDSRNDRVPSDVKLEFVFSLIFVVASIAFYLTGGYNVAMGLVGVAGGTALAGLFGLAKHHKRLGASKQ